MLKMLPALPMLNIDPALPMLRIEPTLPMLKIEAALPILAMLKKLRRLLWLRALRASWALLKRSHPETSALCEALGSALDCFKRGTAYLLKTFAPFIFLPIPQPASCLLNDVISVPATHRAKPILYPSEALHPPAYLGSALFALGRLTIAGSGPPLTWREEGGCVG